MNTLITERRSNQVDEAHPEDSSHISNAIRQGSTPAKPNWHAQRRRVHEST